MKFVIKYQLDIVFWYLIPGGILPWWSTDTCRTRFISWSNIFYLTKWHNSNNQISFLDRKCSSNLNRSGKTRKKSHNELHQKSGSKSCLKLNNGRCQRTEQIYIYKYIKKLYIWIYIYMIFLSLSSKYSPKLQLFLVQPLPEADLGFVYLVLCKFSLFF